MNTSIELHAAFVWDCDDCGRENFVRAMEGELDEKVLDIMCETQDIVGDFVAGNVEPSEHPDSEYEAQYLIERVTLAPRFVTCAHCGRMFPAIVDGMPDDDSDDDDDFQPVE